MLWKFIIESYRVKKNRPLSFVINWIGLTLAFMAVVIVYFYISSEVAHDKSTIDKTGSTYRIGLGWGGIVPAPAVSYLKDNIAEIESATKIGYDYKVTISKTDAGVDTGAVFSSIMYADSSLHDVIPYRMIAGGGAASLASIDQVWISRKTAEALFGTTDVIGRGISIKNKLNASITGVFEDAMQPSVFRPGIIANINIYIPMFNVGSNFLDSWNRWMYEGHIKLAPGVDPAVVQEKMRKVLADRATAMGETIDPQELDKYTLTKFSDIYFMSETTMGATSDPKNLWLMATIAILILVIGIINYVNIYTARTTEIIRSMGIKQIMGAGRGSLILYVIFDSILIAFVSVITAYAAVMLIRPYLLTLLGYEIPFDITAVHGVVLFVALPVICGVLSGMFPSIYLTRMSPLKAIANRSSGGRLMGLVRNGLIVLQFVISISLIASMLIVNRQIDHLEGVDTGYDRDNIVVVGGQDFMKSRFDTFRSQLLANPDIKNAGISKWFPANVGERMGIKINESDPDDANFGTDVMFIDDNMFSILDIKLLEGDTLHMSRKERILNPRWIINETLAGQIRNSRPEVTLPSGTIAGTVKDFNYQSLHMPIGPLVIAPIYQDGYDLCDAYIRISDKNFDETMAFIERTFKEVFPKEIYEFSFFDSRFEAMYQLETQIRKWLFAFSTLAIIIACLGLFALVGYSIERRRKEIGLRKINGATEREVVFMLCYSFLRWLGVAFVIAVPLVYVFMHKWLQGFAYKTDMPWWIFLAAGAATLVIAVATVSYQSWKAATENPAKSLKAE